MVLCSAFGYTQTPKWINNVRLSGFGIVQYQYNGLHNGKTDKSNTFNLRLGRISLDGSCSSTATHPRWERRRAW